MEEAGPGRFAERPIIRHQAQDTPTHLAALIFQAVYGEKGQGFWTPCPMTRYVHDMFRLERQRGGSKHQAFAAHSLQPLDLCGYFELSSTSHHEGSDVKQQITSQQETKVSQVKEL
ncbi:uncharacterized protein LOC124864664 isoform X2 [Girardinichthys multiradiatus]|uniref:uncharacterized protein LOC124864664 isoform X2 n=1 Tax=Girardinichthys multiradiatus TaxID=208333 RepID=UPI001FABC418|nr:uncharacterized protein LOC124864664 isoform X2 [Girardinichthys multiradiatus]